MVVLESNRVLNQVPKIGAKINGRGPAERDPPRTHTAGPRPVIETNFLRSTRHRKDRDRQEHTDDDRKRDDIEFRERLDHFHGNWQF